MTSTLASLLITLTLTAAEGKSPYQPMGAPADPKVAARWNRYHDYSEATELLRAMAKAHPTRARLESLGRSYGDRQMWLLTITHRKKGTDRQKPAFWIDGGIHANEIQGTEVTLYTAWYLLEMYGRNPLITRLVDRRTFYLVPMMSPDSRDAHMHRAATTNSPRSGQVPVDDDRDGLVDEDPADDLDGDGHITRMRVADPLGRWKPHAEYPRLMIQAEADQPGGYRMLGTEGFDNDGDGRVNEDGAGYYDPNRDWAWGWQPRHVQGGAYRYPFSVPENRLVADFVTDHRNIAGMQSYHNTGGMILRGPGTKGEHFEPGDVAVMDSIGKKGELMLPGYRYIALGADLYEARGGEFDWFYNMQGVMGFSNELFTRFNYFRKSTEDATSAEKKEDAEAFNRYLLFDQGAVDWHEVEHPQYGKIEVGGLKKQWGRQPPSFLLEEECHRNMAFTLYHADQMPQVEVRSIAIEPAGAGLTRVTAVVANPKLVPSRTAIDVKHKISPPEVVTIEGTALEVVTGLTASEPFFEKANEQKRRPASMRVDTIPGRGAVYVRWFVRGKPPYTVTVRSSKGGTARRVSGE